MYPYSSSAGPIANGNAFLAQTPETDNAVNQLYQQEQQRKDRAQQNAIAMDQQMAKDAGEMRGVDLPEFTKAYQDYKQAQINADTNPKLQRDPVAKAQAQQDAMNKLSTTYSIMANSKQTKHDLADINTVSVQHSEKLVDEYPDLLNAAAQTPTSQLNNVTVKGQKYDLSHPGAFIDNTPRADLTGMQIKAAGKPMERNATEVVDPKDNLSSLHTPIMFGNDPITFKNNLASYIANAKGGEKTAAAAFSIIPPAEIQQKDAAYNNLTTDQWKNINGSGVAQPLTYNDNMSNAEKYSVYQTQVSAINQAQHPMTGKQVSIRNREATTEVNQTNKVLNQKQELTNALIRIKAGGAAILGRESDFDVLKRNRNLMSRDDANTASDQFVANEIKSVQKPENAVSYTTTTGQKLDGYKISVDPAITKQLSTGKGTIHEFKPLETVYDPKTNEIKGIFNSGDEGQVTTTRMPMTQVNMTYRNVINKNHSDQEGGASTTPKVHGKSGVVWQP